MSYATLLTRFTTWVKRTDQTANFPDYLSLAEAKFNRFLRMRQQETAFSGTPNATYEIALPADFLSFKALWPTATPQVFLSPASVDVVQALQNVTGFPTKYAVNNTAVEFDGGQSVSGIYYASVPGLQTSGTNWLETYAPDLYLAGVLAEAYIFMEDANRAAAWTGQRDLLLQQLQDNDMRDRYAGRLVATKR